MVDDFEHFIKKMKDPKTIEGTQKKLPNIRATSTIIILLLSMRSSKANASLQHGGKVSAISYSLRSGGMMLLFEQMLTATMLFWEGTFEIRTVSMGCCLVTLKVSCLHLTQKVFQLTCRQPASNLGTDPSCN